MRLAAVIQSAACVAGIAVHCWTQPGRATAPRHREDALIAAGRMPYLQFLLLVARGASSRDVARQLVIADKTARNHIERIYTKLGVSTRAEASL
jgi:FixJ family two-component response regulator